MIGVFVSGESKYDIYFWIGLFLPHVFGTFRLKKAKIRQKWQIVSHKCTSLPLMKGLSEKSIHSSAQKQFAVQESVLPNVY